MASFTGHLASFFYTYPVRIPTTIPDSNLSQACCDAAVDHIVRSLPGGYNADLLEGATNLI